MRLFVSVDASRSIKEKVSKIIGSFMETGADVKFVDPENLHITIKFLGEVNEADAEKVKSIISDCVRGENGFTVSFRGVGFFGSPANIRTIWVGIEKGRKELVDLSKNVNLGLKHMFTEEPLSPHLTIGRVKTGKNHDKLVEGICSLKNVNMGEMDVNSVILKKSTLTKQGPVYEDICVFEMGR